ncbi:MAG: homoserine O-acetyltransferase [Desulfovibrionaceae bacterium]|jgi:homoserine O-acetyltransferase|nr:homoserine O-acetyltransferase [Desulfovibrionaceae bacterium]
MSEYVDAALQEPSVGVVDRRTYTFADDAPFRLTGGATLAPVTLAYETYGALNAARDNAVLVAHALTGDSHVAGRYSESDPKPGWWELMVGPGKPIDTDRFFVICSNVLGGCMGSTGPAAADPATGRPYGLDFPVVTIADMVRAQRRLVEHLGVTRLLAAVGGSMGGMQVLEWAVRYPDRVAVAVPLATTARHSALNIAFNEIARQAILADPNFNGGDYYGHSAPEACGLGQGPRMGLAVARMIGHVTYLSDEAMRQKFGRRLQDRDAFSFDLDADLPDFQVESYLRYQGRKFVERFDANSFLYVTKAADYFDLAEQHGQGSLTHALSKARARFLLVSFTSDWLYPTAASRELVTAMKKNGLDVSFLEITADCGHDAFLLRNQRLSGLVRDFLRHAHDDVQQGNL